MNFHDKAFAAIGRVSIFILISLFMLSSFRRTSFIRDIINYFLPGINTSKQKSYYSMMVEPVIIKPRDNHTATVIFFVI